MSGETLLQIPAELTGSQTKSVSKTTKLTFESQESVPPELISKITAKVGKTGWLCFLAEERPLDVLDVVGLPEIKAEKGEKSKSARLRGVLYRLWEQTGRVGDSETHYQIHMEKYIEHVKSRIQEAM